MVQFKPVAAVLGGWKLCPSETFKEQAMIAVSGQSFGLLFMVERIRARCRGGHVLIMFLSRVCNGSAGLTVHVSFEALHVLP